MQEKLRVTLLAPEMQQLLMDKYKKAKLTREDVNYHLDEMEDWGITLKGMTTVDLLITRDDCELGPFVLYKDKEIAFWSIPGVIAMERIKEES